MASDSGVSNSATFCLTISGAPLIGQILRDYIFVGKVDPNLNEYHSSRCQPAKIATYLKRRNKFKQWHAKRHHTAIKSEEKTIELAPNSEQDPMMVELDLNKPPPDEVHWIITEGITATTTRTNPITYSNTNTNTIPNTNASAINTNMSANIKTAPNVKSHTNTANTIVTTTQATDLQQTKTKVSKDAIPPRIEIGSSVQPSKRARVCHSLLLA